MSKCGGGYLLPGAQGHKFGDACGASECKKK